MILRNAAAFSAGLIFAVGLSLCGMTDPGKVIGFLRVRGWDPSLIVVMAAATLVFGVAFRVAQKRTAPLLGGRFEIPAQRAITPRLLAGATLFGMGWGLAGYCGGPALASLLTGRTDVIVFIAAMIAGTAIATRLGY